jgi:hypothetical protein
VYGSTDNHYGRVSRQRGSRRFQSSALSRVLPRFRRYRGFLQKDDRRSCIGDDAVGRFYGANRGDAQPFFSGLPVPGEPLPSRFGTSLLVDFRTTIGNLSAVSPWQKRDGFSPESFLESVVRDPRRFLRAQKNGPFQGKLGGPV